MKTIVVTIDQPQKDNEVLVHQLDNITEASCDNIVLGATLDYVEDRSDVLLSALKRLRYGGSIEILGTDIFDVGRGITFCELSLSDIQKLIYDGRRSVDTVQNVIYQLENLGLVIKIKRLHKYVYYIKAIRPALDS